MAHLELVVSTPAAAMLAVAFVIFLLGWIALAQARPSAVNASFFAMTLSASIWLGSTAILMMSTTESAAVLWARITYIGVCAIPAAVLQFTFALIGDLRERSRILIATWTTSALFIALFLGTDQFITGVWHYTWGYYARLGVASIAFLAFFGAVLATSLFALHRALHEGQVDQRTKRIASFLVALGVAYAGSIDYLPSFGVGIRPIGWIATFGFVVLAARAMWRFSLADLTPSYLAARLLENVQGGVIIVDMHGVVRVANPAASQMLGGDLVGSDLREALKMKRLPASESSTFASRGHIRKRMMTWQRRDGGTVDVELSATLLRDRGELPVGILYVLTDLTERKRAERHEFAANHDPLTGLPNRAYLANRYEHTSDDIAARGRIAGVLFLDLNGFKAINDQHGHAIGDRLLQLVATRLRNALRDDDHLARYGGDEFVALVSLRCRGDAAGVAAKLNNVLR